MQVAIEKAVQLLVFIRVQAVGAKIRPPYLQRLCMDYTGKDAKMLGNRILSASDAVVIFRVLQQRGEALHRRVESLSQCMIM